MNPERAKSHPFFSGDMAFPDFLWGLFASRISFGAKSTASNIPDRESPSMKTKRGIAGRPGKKADEVSTKFAERGKEQVETTEKDEKEYHNL